MNNSRSELTVHNIRRILFPQTAVLLPDLVDLLKDSVEHGASVGFLLPVSRDEIENYWRETFEQVERGNRVLIVSEREDEITGTVQLDLATKPNGLHRAEVQKLMVHSRHRNQGIAEMLMSSIEDVARELERSLLVLDTLKGHAAEKLYEKWGFTRAGEIPNYARVNDLSLQPTVVFYKIL